MNASTRIKIRPSSQPVLANAAGSVSAPVPTIKLNKNIMPICECNGEGTQSEGQWLWHRKVIYCAQLIERILPMMDMYRWGPYEVLVKSALLGCFRRDANFRDNLGYEATLCPRRKFAFHSSDIRFCVRTIWIANICEYHVSTAILKTTKFSCDASRLLLFFFFEISVARIHTQPAVYSRCSGNFHDRTTTPTNVLFVSDCFYFRLYTVRAMESSCS